MSLKQKIISKATKALNLKEAFYLHEKRSPIIVKDKGVSFEIEYYSPSLLKKLSDPPKKLKNDPLLPPFVDSLFVGKTDTNNIIINKFMNMKGHIVISSADPNAEQGTPATKGDFNDISKILDDFKEGVAYYNCGLNSGCSQLHKHLQFCPLKSTPLFDAMGEKTKLPFVYRSEKLGSIKPDEIESAYKQLTKGLSTNHFNFIVNNKAACVIPRILPMHKRGIVVNSIAMCGVFSIAEETDDYIFKHPMDIITDVCVPLE